MWLHAVVYACAHAGLNDVSSCMANFFTTDLINTTTTTAATTATTLQNCARIHYEVVATTATTATAAHVHKVLQFCSQSLDVDVVDDDVVESVIRRMKAVALIVWERCKPPQQQQQDDESSLLLLSNCCSSFLLLSLPVDVLIQQPRECADVFNVMKCCVCLLVRKLRDVGLMHQSTAALRFAIALLTVKTAINNNNSSNNSNNNNSDNNNKELEQLHRLVRDCVTSRCAALRKDSPATAATTTTAHDWLLSLPSATDISSMTLQLINGHIQEVDDISVEILSVESTACFQQLRKFVRNRSKFWSEIVNTLMSRCCRCLQQLVEHVVVDVNRICYYIQWGQLHLITNGYNGYNGPMTIYPHGNGYMSEEGHRHEHARACWQWCWDAIQQQQQDVDLWIKGEVLMLLATDNSSSNNNNNMMLEAVECWEQATTPPTQHTTTFMSSTSSMLLLLYSNRLLSLRVSLVVERFSVEPQHVVDVVELLISVGLTHDAKQLQQQRGNKLNEMTTTYTTAAITSATDIKNTTTTTTTIDQQTTTTTDVSVAITVAKLQIARAAAYITNGNSNAAETTTTNAIRLCERYKRISSDTSPTGSNWLLLLLLIDSWCTLAYIRELRGDPAAAKRLYGFALELQQQLRRNGYKGEVEMSLLEAKRGWNEQQQQQQQQQQRQQKEEQQQLELDVCDVDDIQRIVAIAELKQQQQQHDEALAVVVTATQAIEQHLRAIHSIHNTMDTRCYCSTCEENINKWIQQLHQQSDTQRTHARVFVLYLQLLLTKGKSLLANGYIDDACCCLTDIYKSSRSNGPTCVPLQLLGDILVTRVTALQQQQQQQQQQQDIGECLHEAWLCTQLLADTVLSKKVNRLYALHLLQHQQQHKQNEIAMLIHKSLGITQRHKLERKQQQQQQQQVNVDFDGSIDLQTEAEKLKLSLLSLPSEWTVLSLCTAGDHVIMTTSTRNGSTSQLLTSTDNDNNNDNIVDSILQEFNGILEADAVTVLNVPKSSEEVSDDIKRKWWKTRRQHDEQMKRLVQRMETDILGTAADQLRQVIDNNNNSNNDNNNDNSNNNSNDNSYDSNIDDDDDVVVVVEALDESVLMKWTVKKLRAELRSRQLKVSGKKSELVARLLTTTTATDTTTTTAAATTATTTITTTAAATDTTTTTTAAAATTATTTTTSSCGSGSVILVLSEELQRLPWESIPLLRNRSVTRCPSIDFILSRCCSSSSKYIRCDNISYVLNPEGNLSSTQSTMLPLFQQYNWKPIAQAGTQQTQQQWEQPYR